MSFGCIYMDIYVRVVVVGNSMIKILLMLNLRILIDDVFKRLVVFFIEN